MLKNSIYYYLMVSIARKASGTSCVIELFGYSVTTNCASSPVDTVTITGPAPTSVT
jgi:hypothetical protein